MTKKTAYQLGVNSGLEAGQYGDFSAAELADEDAFVEACSEIGDNKRQYAGHPCYDFNGQSNSDALYDAFDHGETVGIRKAWRARQRQAAELRRKARKCRKAAKWRSRTGPQEDAQFMYVCADRHEAEAERLMPAARE